jgi:signal transduction histidine kinase
VLAKGFEKLHLLDSKSLAVVREIPLELGAGSPPSTVFSPDGKTLAVVHNRFDVRLLDLPTGRELATFSPPHPAQAVWSQGLAFSSDGRWLVMAKQDGEIVAWDLPVIRAELAKLGLDWGGERGSMTRSALEIQKMLRLAEPRSERESGFAGTTVSRAGLVGSPALTIAFCAVTLALAAGLFVSLHQRRMLSAYVRADALTVEQQHKLQTAQEQLQHSQKMRALGTLSAGIAHDFNNLLSVVRLSMLGYSRAAAELENEYSVAAAVSETVAMLGKKFLSGIVLKLEVEPDIPPVRGVRGRLEQVLLNLVVNASEAMNGQGTLELTARVIPHANGCILPPQPAPRYVALSVGDSGPGISAEILPRIFDPFFTTKNAGARPGTGLGLSTVYTMAQQDGLGLAVETSDHAGTIFRILVPIAGHAQKLPQRISEDERKMPSAPLVRAAYGEAEI